MLQIALVNPVRPALFRLEVGFVLSCRVPYKSGILTRWSWEAVIR